MGNVVTSRVILLVIGIIFFLVAARLLNTRSSYTTTTVIINNQRLTLEIADADELRAQGLSGRKSLTENNGMLFIFPTAGYYSFWMKEMEFPLDFLWINKETIVDLSENVPAPINQIGKLPTVVSKSPADKVIEVNAGTISKNNIKIGDRVAF